MRASVAVRPSSRKAFRPDLTTLQNRLCAAVDTASRVLPGRLRSDPAASAAGNARVRPKAPQGSNLGPPISSGSVVRVLTSFDQRNSLSDRGPEGTK